jgi:sec-independent protein translocase protein TatB
MFGINGWEALVLIVLAVVILGPERLPEYAAKLAQGVRKVRVMAEGARVTLKDQLGPEYQDINWRQYDPRQYDPRRIVREALAEPLDYVAQPFKEVADEVRTVRDEVRGVATTARASLADQGVSGAAQQGAAPAGVTAAAAVPGAGSNGTDASAAPLNAAPLNAAPSNVIGPPVPALVPGPARYWDNDAT